MSLLLLYGGTFDPVHAGHLAVARAARATLAADVAFLPSADPPHRPPPGASAEQRARMIALAIAGETGFALDTRELHRPGPSYTADTLRELRRERGGQAPLAWLIGADAFLGLADWHDWTALFDLAHFVVAERPGHALDRLPEPLRAACEGRWTDDAAVLGAAPAGRLFRLALPLRPESASAIRQALAAGRDPGDWLPPAVAGHIRAQGLYRASGL